MRLDAPIEEKGLFWLATAPDHKVPGVLRIAENGRATLELTGSSEDHRGLVSFMRDDIERIVGRCVNGDPITLTNCYFLNQNFSPIPQSTLRAERVFIGVGYPEESEITFYKVKFSIEGLDEWLGISGIKSSFSSDVMVSITYTPPKTIVIPLGDDLTLAIAWDSSIPVGGNRLKEAKITQAAYMHLECDEPRKIEELLALIFKINNFMCFAINDTVTLRSVTAWSKDVVSARPNNTTFEKPIGVYGQTLPYADETPDIQFHEMLFGYGFIAPRFEDVMNKWLEACEESGPTINLYLASQAGKHAYQEWLFLSVAQALEVLHRRSSNETSMPREEFTSLLDTVVSASPKARRNWLRTKLQYANELSLRKRLSKLVKPFGELFGNESQRTTFIGRVTDTRNYLTHYDESLAARAAEGRSLWELCRKMEALCQLHILLMMGLEVDTLSSMAKTNYVLRRRIGLIND